MRYNYTTVYFIRYKEYEHELIRKRSIRESIVRVMSITEAGTGISDFLLRTRKRFNHSILQYRCCCIRFWNGRQDDGDFRTKIGTLQTADKKLFKHEILRRARVLSC